MIWKLPKTKQNGSHHWELAPPVEPGELAALDGVPPQIAPLLWGRGIRTAQDADAFFAKPALVQLPDPYLLTDMDNAIARLHVAKEQKERVVVFGDNDPDGTCGAVMLMSLLDALRIEASVYLPDRLAEGHAMTSKAVKEITKRKATLVITVDTGVRETESITALKNKGIETIVLDHHIVPDVLPPAVAIVDPRRIGEPYGFDGLCGAAVAFVFIQAMTASPLGKALPEDFLDHQLDLVAIATIADMVPLKGPNRVLLRLGLSALRTTTRPGLLALYASAGITPAHIDEHTIAFDIAPRINAVARVDHASTAYTLLAAPDKETAEPYAKEMNVLNRKRKREVDAIIARAMDALSKEDLPPIVIVRDDTFSPTMVGIAASRVREKTNHPVFLCSRVSDGIRCSGRSSETFHLLDAMEACGGANLFADYGGHTQAAGLTVQEQWFDLFAERMQAYAASQGHAAVHASLTADLTLAAHEVAPVLAEWIERLRPFGKDNPRPRFLIKNLEVLESRSAGSRGSGVRIKLVAAQGGRTLSAVSKNAEALPAFRPGDRIDVLAEIRTDSFKGQSLPVLALLDVRPSENLGPRA